MALVCGHNVVITSRKRTELLRGILHVFAHIYHYVMIPHTRSTVHIAPVSLWCTGAPPYIEMVYAHARTRSFIAAYLSKPDPVHSE